MGFGSYIYHGFGLTRRNVEDVKGLYRGKDGVDRIAYDCANLAIYLLFWDMLKQDKLKQLFKKLITMPPYFNNTHTAKNTLEVECKTITPISTKIKTFFTTRCYDCNVGFQSVLDWRRAISKVYISEMTKPANENQLREIYDKKSKTDSDPEPSLERKVRSTLSFYTPVFEVF